ncbi:putative 4.4 kDa transmembrane protein [Cordyline virus 4]|uniref:Putative 4.4 kDa transmembrane protein n=1 Tax=Cordyline virus 4 TaxID=1177753 RepID=M1NRB2_9CLOS|nr:putative 4.4 kDa transmembrane protein [Cordyline virus 4]AGF73888.1 putative 4.4 kDa transmembrane protein [Cordyline virus 4]
MSLLRLGRNITWLSSMIWTPTYKFIYQVLMVVKYIN